MTDSMTFFGMYHLTAKTVSVTIGGIDCGDYVVAGDGSVIVPFGADASGLVTPAFLIALDGPDYGDAAVPIKITLADASVVTVTVPVVMGYTYVSQGQVLRPLAEAETRSQTGGSLGLTRRTHMFSALLHNAQGISFGTNFNNLTLATLAAADGSALDDGTLYSGVYWNVIADNYSFDSQLCWQVSRPVPATVVAVGQFLDVQERT